MGTAPGGRRTAVAAGGGGAGGAGGDGGRGRRLYVSRTGGIGAVAACPSQRWKPGGGPTGRLPRPAGWLLEGPAAGGA